MGGKYYGDGCGDETWIELAQSRVHFFWYWCCWNVASCCHMLTHLYAFQIFTWTQMPVDAAVFAPVFFVTYFNSLQKIIRIRDSHALCITVRLHFQIFNYSTKSADICYENYTTVRGPYVIPTFSDNNMTVGRTCKAIPILVTLATLSTLASLITEPEMIK